MVPTSSFTSVQTHPMHHHKVRLIQHLEDGEYSVGWTSEKCLLARETDNEDLFEARSELAEVKRKHSESELKPCSRPDHQQCILVKLKIIVYLEISAELKCIREGENLYLVRRHFPIYMENPAELRILETCQSHDARNSLQKDTRLSVFPQGSHSVSQSPLQCLNCVEGTSNNKYIIIIMINCTFISEIHPKGNCEFLEEYKEYITIILIMKVQLLFQNPRFREKLQKEMLLTLKNICLRTVTKVSDNPENLDLDVIIGNRHREQTRKQREGRSLIGAGEMANGSSSRASGLEGNREVGESSVRVGYGGEGNRQVRGSGISMQRAGGTGNGVTGDEVNGEVRKVVGMENSGGTGSGHEGKIEVRGSIVETGAGKYGCEVNRELRGSEGVTETCACGVKGKRGERVCTIGVENVDGENTEVRRNSSCVCAVGTRSIKSENEENREVWGNIVGTGSTERTGNRGEGKREIKGSARGTGNETSGGEGNEEVRENGEGTGSETSGGEGNRDVGGSTTGTGSSGGAGNGDDDDDNPNGPLRDDDYLDINEEDIHEEGDDIEEDESAQQQNPFWQFITEAENALTQLLHKITLIKEMLFQLLGVVNNAEITTFIQSQLVRLQNVIISAHEVLFVAQSGDVQFSLNEIKYLIRKHFIAMQMNLITIQTDHLDFQRHISGPEEQDVVLRDISIQIQESLLKMQTILITFIQRHNL